MAGQEPQLEIQIVLDDGTIKKGFATIKNQAKKSGKSSGHAFGSSFNASFSSFLGNVGAIAFTNMMSSIKSSVGDVVVAAQKLEVFETQFKTMLGSSQAAQRQLKDLQNFAASTPFQIEGLALATRQLLSFGVAQSDVIDTLGTLGDMAAGVGASIDELTIPYGRLISTQKLTLVELDKFADRGVNIYGQLSKQTGISLKSIRDDISKNKISFSEFTKALEIMTSKGGKFYQGMDAQSKTLSGVLSTLDDNVFNLQGTFGATFKEELVKVAQDFTTIIQTLNKNLIQNGPILKERFSKVFDFLFITPTKFWIDFFTGNSSGNVTKLAGDLEAMKAELSAIEADMEKHEGNFVYDSMFGRKEDNEQRRAELFAEITEVSTKLEEMRLASIPAEGDQGFVGPIQDLKALSKQSDKTAKSIKKDANTMGKAMSQMATRAISGSIQTMVTSIINGQNAFSNFGKFVLALFGDMAIQLGEMFILKGIAIESMTKLAGGAAVAAGVALVALGSVMKAYAGNGGGIADTSADGGGGGIAFNDSSNSVVEQDEEERKEAGTSVTVNVDGSVMGTDKESLASAIVEMINEHTNETGATLA